MIAFIDDHREAHGVEPICKVLPIAPSTYHAHVARRVDPAKRSARAGLRCRNHDALARQMLWEQLAGGTLATEWLNRLRSQRSPLGDEFVLGRRRRETLPTRFVSFAVLWPGPPLTRGGATTAI